MAILPRIDKAKLVIDAQHRQLEKAPSGRGQSRVGPFAGPKIDRDRLGVTGEVIGIDAAAVPDRHEDDVMVRQALAGPIDKGLPRGRAPGVDRIKRPGVVVCAIHVLQGGDIGQHRGLRRVDVGEGRFVRRIRLVTHDRIFVADMRGIHRKSGMRQSERMADLMQERQECGISLDRCPVGLRIQPEVAILGAVTRKVTARRRRRIVGRQIRHSDPQIGGVAGGLGKCQVGVLAEDPERLADRILQLRRKLLKAMVLLATVVVLRGAGREAEEQISGAPFCARAVRRYRHRPTPVPVCWWRPLQFSIMVDQSGRCAAGQVVEAGIASASGPSQQSAIRGGYPEIADGRDDDRVSQGAWSCVKTLRCR